MAPYSKAMIAAGAALLLGTISPVSALPLEEAVNGRSVPGNLIRDVKQTLTRRDPPTALPESADEGSLKYQPAMDFDTDGCYNTPAVDADGNVAEGLDHNYTGAADECHDLSDLQNNNVYVRDRCNNGWCAYVYDYYFEKDVAVQEVIDAGGHRNDWEHVIVFVSDSDPSATVVAASAHGDYDTKTADEVRWDGDTHPKIVYHKDGGSTHAFRFANEDDDDIENDLGEWFYGDLVSWNGFPSVEVRDAMMGYDFGSASIAITDDAMFDNLNHAKNDVVPGFDSAVDEGTPSPVGNVTLSSSSSKSGEEGVETRDERLGRVERMAKEALV